ncbi:MAG: hypothetical protein KAT65_16310, partial [Methanophagales archaeon]|nr:hypothetical protein [Methanophagales archaeon]
SLRVRNVLLVGLQFLNAKMDGAIVAVGHDKFREMGLGMCAGLWTRGRRWSMCRGWRAGTAALSVMSNK